MTAPTFSPNGGTYTTTVNVTIACSTSGAVIHYTTNGADPTENDPVVASGSAVLIGRNLTLKAKAWASGSPDSAVKAALYQSTGQIVAGLNHSLALGEDGTLWSWGQNNYGQLGIGSTADQWFPGLVSGLSNVAVAAGGIYHSVAAKADGTVWAWGYNAYGQVGDGTMTQRLTPVQVSGLSGVVAVAAGDMSVFIIPARRRAVLTLFRRILCLW